MLKYAKSGEYDEMQNKSKLQASKHRLVLAESDDMLTTWLTSHGYIEIYIMAGKRSFHHKPH